MYDFSVSVSQDDILEKLTEYDIYSYYLGSNFKVNSKFKSPFRDDSNPSFGIFVSNKTRSLLFKDFATGDTGNCFKLVQLLFNLSYTEALQRIHNDMILNKVTQSEYGKLVRDKYEPPRTKLFIKQRNYTKDDIEFWSSFHISKNTLNKYKVVPAEAVWKNDIIISTHYKSNPIYAYIIFNKFKIYKPFDEKYKFISNCSIYDVQGFEQLPKKGDLLFITKSLKDCMVLYELGYSSVSANSETTMIPKKVMINLKKRFNRIILFYDNDSAGIKGATDMSKEYDLEYIMIPDSNIKDISDYIKLKGLDESLILIKNLINNAKS